MARPNEDQVFVLSDDDFNSSPSICNGSSKTGTADDIQKYRKTIRNQKLRIVTRNLDDTAGRSLFDFYFITAKTCSDPDWEDWRNSLTRTIGGHTIGELFGFGSGISPHGAFLNLVGQTQKKEANWFGKKAQQHGRDKEVIAKDFVLNHKEMIGKDFALNHDFKPFQIVYYEPESLLYEVSKSTGGGNPVLVCVSPDILFDEVPWDRSAIARKNKHLPLCVVEIKAPYYGSEDFFHPKDFSESHSAKQIDSHGVAFNPSWWIQTAFYAWILGIDFFEVRIVFYCSKTDLFLIKRYEFMNSMKVRRFFCSQFDHLLGVLSVYDVSGVISVDKPKSKFKPFPNLKTCKQMILQLFKQSLLSIERTGVYYHNEMTKENTLHFPEILEEQTEDGPWDE